MAAASRSAPTSANGPASGAPPPVMTLLAAATPAAAAPVLRRCSAAAALSRICGGADARMLTLIGKPAEPTPPAARGGHRPLGSAHGPRLLRLHRPLDRAVARARAARGGARV